MRANPEPVVAVIRFVRERAVSITDPDGPEGADSLEVERGVSRVCLEQGVVLVRSRANVRRQGLVQGPELG